MKKMVSPSIVGVAVATARVDPGAIAATTTGTRVATVMVYLVQILSRCRCLHRRMIIGKRTRGAIKSREASPLASWVEPKLLCLIVTSCSCREIAAAQPNAGNRLMKWSTSKIGFNEEDHPTSTKGVGTIPLLYTPTINNIAVNHTLIDGGAGHDIISVEVFEKMQVSYHRLMPTRPFLGVTEGSTMPIGQVRLPIIFGT
jgi:hypothetical protein